MMGEGCVGCQDFIVLLADSLRALEYLYGVLDDDF